MKKNKKKKNIETRKPPEYAPKYFPDGLVEYIAPEDYERVIAEETEKMKRFKKYGDPPPYLGEYMPDGTFMWA